MRMVKEKVLAIIGTISTLVGTVGAIIASFGLCICFWAPVFSFLGIISLVFVFISEKKTIFLVTGVILLFISFIFHNRKHSCSIHKRNKEEKKKKIKEGKNIEK